ncbi:MAG TPA: S8 family serine peptidase [bacterium]|nr:S8 family serine peptidase [bacterium]HPT29975.1 S8 family serine peptidase [bacterium]
MKRFIAILSLMVFSLPLASAQAAFFPDDVYYGRQWYLEKIQAYEAWDKINASPSAVIAVIDSGVQISHPELKDNIWVNSREIPGNEIDDDHNGFIDDINGWDFVLNTPNPEPKFSEKYNDSGISHGTMIAGVISATGNNSYGVAGVTWQSKLMALRALNDSGEGRMADVVRAIDYAVSNGADIINLSFSTPSYSEALKGALERAYRAGVIVVAAAGNEQASGQGYNLDQTPLYPVCYQGDNGENLVIGVGATDALDQKTPFSSYGSQCIDISAPGVSFFSTATYNPDAYQGQFNKYFDGYWSGTSLAAPLVSGTLALVREANPNLSRDEIINVVLRSADNINAFNPEYIGKLGTGRLNVGAAVNWATERLNDQSGRIVVSPYWNRTSPFYYRFASHVNKIDWRLNDGSIEKEVSWGDKARLGVNVSSGDINGNGQSEIILAPGAGSDPYVTILNQSGQVLSKFLAYSKTMRGGVSVTSGDINGDGKLEIITAPASAAYPQVKIFNAQGKLIKDFLAYDRRFIGGVNVAAGDVNGDGTAEIVTAPASGGGPHIRVFDSQARILNQFMAYDKNFRGGVNINVGNIDGRLDRSRDEIIVAPIKDSEPRVKAFANDGRLKLSFLAYDEKFKNGVSLASGDVNNDGRVEIITGAGPGGTPHVRTWNNRGDLIDSFYAYSDSFDKGLTVGFILSAK